MEPQDWTTAFFPVGNDAGPSQLPLLNLTGLNGIYGGTEPSQLPNQLSLPSFAYSSHSQNPAYPFKRYNADWHNSLLASQHVEHQQQGRLHVDPPSETANQATSGGFLSSILQNPISSNFDPGSNTLDLQLQSSTAVGVEPSQSCNLPFEPSQPAPMGLIGTSVSPAFGQTASIGSQTEPGTQVKRSVPVARAVEVRFFPPTTDIKAHPNLFSSKLDSPSAFEAWSNPMLRLPGSSSCDLQGNILSHFDSSRMQNGSTGCHRSFGNGLDSQEKPAAYNLEPKPAVTSDRATSGTFAGLQDICSDFHKPFTSEHAASLNISSQAQQDVQVTRCQSGGARGLGPSLSRNDLKASPESSRKHRSEKLLNDVADPEADECPGEEVSSPLHSPPSAKQWQTPPQVLRKLRQSAKLLDEEPACVRLIGSLGRDGESEPNSSVPLDRGKKGVEHGQAESRAVASGSRKTGGVKSTLVDRPARSRGSLATSCSGMPGLERLDWLASVATECRSPSEPANQDAKKILRKPRTPVSFRTCKASTLSGSQNLDSILEEAPQVAGGEQEATSPRRKALPLKKRPHKETSSSLAAVIFSPRPVKSPLQPLRACEGSKQSSLEQEKPGAAPEKKRKLNPGSAKQIDSPRGLLRSPQGRFVSKKEAAKPEEGEREEKRELQRVKRAAELALRVPPEPKKPKLEVEGVVVKKRGRPPKHASKGKEKKEKREGKEGKKAKGNAGNAKGSKKQAVRVLVKGKGKGDGGKKSHKKKPPKEEPKGKGASGKKKVKVQKKGEKKEGAKGLKKDKKLEGKERAGAFKVAPKAKKTAATPDSSPVPPQSATLAACLDDKRVNPSGEKETRIQKFARYILNYIGRERTPESVIRKEMGNTPDTSKALRMLVSDKKVNRRGTGGRPDPFIYKITKKGLTHLEAVHAAYGSMPTQTYHPSAAATPRPSLAADVPETPAGSAHHAPRLVSPGSQEP